MNEDQEHRDASNAAFQGIWFRAVMLWKMQLLKSVRNLLKRILFLNKLLKTSHPKFHQALIKWTSQPCVIKSPMTLKINLRNFDHEEFAFFLRMDRSWTCSQRRRSFQFDGFDWRSVENRFAFLFYISYNILILLAHSVYSWNRFYESLRWPRMGLHASHKRTILILPGLNFMQAFVDFDWYLMIMLC